MAEPFIAEVRIWALNFAPRGWAFCNGSLLPIAQNTALFSLIGTTFGGDGRTTTALPNLQGRAPMHPGNGPGLTSRRLGERGGVEQVTLTEAQMAQHNHVLSGDEGSTEEEGQGNPAGQRTGETDASDRIYAPNGSALVNMAGGALPSAGGSQAHNNLQPYLTLNFCIALVGTFPSSN